MNIGNKLFLFLACLFLVNILANAQSFPGGVNPNEEEIQIDNSKFTEFGLYSKFQAINSYTGFELGARFHYVSEGFLAGFGFYSLLTKNALIEDPIRKIPSPIRLTYSGISIGYNYNFAGKSNLSLISGMYIGNLSTNISSSLTFEANPTDNWIILVEPEVRYSFDIYDGIAIGISANYRLAGLVKLSGLDNSKMSGLGFSIILSSKKY